MFLLFHILACQFFLFFFFFAICCQCFCFKSFSLQHRLLRPYFCLAFRFLQSVLNYHFFQFIYNCLFYIFLLIIFFLFLSNFVFSHSSNSYFFFTHTDLCLTALQWNNNSIAIFSKYHGSSTITLCKRQHLVSLARFFLGRKR